MIAVREARCAFVNHHAGDADIFALAQEIFGIVHAAGQRHEVGDRCERDVALAEIELEIEGADRKSVVKGKRESQRVDIGGRGIIKKKKATSTSRKVDKIKKKRLKE